VRLLEGIVQLVWPTIVQILIMSLGTEMMRLGKSHKKCFGASLLRTLRKIESFVTEKFGKTATWVTPFKVGGYNNPYEMKIEGSDEDILI
jgi:hypothetical protein